MPQSGQGVRQPVEAATDDGPLETRSGAWLLFLALMGVCAASLMLYIWQFDPNGPGWRFCEGADAQPCDDLLKANVRVHRHGNTAALRFFCDHPHSDGCALRRVSYSRAACDVHLLASAPDGVLIHELNHCRGWDHAGDSPAAYRAAWHINRVAWIKRGAYLR